MSNARYVLRPRTERDLDAQALYYASEAGSELGHRFLVAAHETIANLAIHPRMGWPSRLERASLKELRIFRVKGFEKILILYLPLPNGVEILRVVHGSQNLQALIRRQRFR